VILSDLAGDQPELCPSVVRARTAYLPDLRGLNRAVGRVVSVRKGFHAEDPGLRIWTSNVVPPVPAPVDHRNLHPDPGVPVVLTGTFTVPRIEGCSVHR
jgi:hypothetical protein